MQIKQFIKTSCFIALFTIVLQSCCSCKLIRPVKQVNDNWDRYAIKIPRSSSSPKQDSRYSEYNLYDDAITEATIEIPDTYKFILKTTTNMVLAQLADFGLEKTFSNQNNLIQAGKLSLVGVGVLATSTTVNPVLTKVLLEELRKDANIQLSFNRLTVKLVDIIMSGPLPIMMEKILHEHGIDDPQFRQQSSCYAGKLIRKFATPGYIIYADKVLDDYAPDNLRNNNYFSRFWEGMRGATNCSMV